MKDVTKLVTATTTGSDGSYWRGTVSGARYQCEGITWAWQGGGECA